jgi:HEAT repeat protein
MNFDFVSFLLGFGSASGLSYGVWRYRERIRNLQESAEGQAESAREFLKRSADARYIMDLKAYLEKQHLAGSLMELSEVLIEPRLLLESAVVTALDEEDAAESAYSNIIPMQYDFPELYASFNIEHSPLTDVLMGDPYVVILGNQGSGKSTALVTLGLMALDVVSFESVQDLTDQILSDELQGLPENERERRQKELEDIQRRAIEQLRIVQGREGEDLFDDEVIELPDIKNYFPIFIHLGDIDLDLNLYGIEVDPAEPIIRAFQQYSSLITGQAAPVLMYQQLERGNCIVLLDGYEDLSGTTQAHVYTWIQNFIAAYGNNRIVMTGPATGYDPLISLGFAPTAIRPWTERDNEKYVGKWVKQWGEVERRKSGKKKIQATGVEDSVVRRLLADNRNRTPLNTTLKILSGLPGDEREIGRRGWYERFLRDYIPEQEQSLPILRELATLMLDRGVYLKQDQIVELASNHFVSDEEGDSHDVADKYVKSLLSSELFVKRAGNAYDFRHPMITAYFGAESLIHDIPQRLSEIATNDSWNQAIELAAAAIDLSPAIYQKLSKAPDLLFTNLFSIVRWLPETPADARWRGEILKRLSAAFVGASQFTTIRARAVAGLVASRDQNVLFILRQGIRNGNPVIRKLACVGMGAIGESEALADLRPMLVDDNREVQLAAGMALGAVGTEAALEMMVQGLLEGEEPLRQVVAESLAGIPNEGHSILRDAVVHQDMMVRRAGVYGLARIPATWALIGLYRAMIEDEQWYVRSAAEYTFARARDPHREGPRVLPAADQLGWLSKWATEMGLAVPEGEKAQQLVVRALQEAPPHIRVMAARSIGKLGLLMGIKPLYLALTDRNEQLRATAYDALGIIQQRVTHPLPSIV